MNTLRILFIALGLFFLGLGIFAGNRSENVSTTTRTHVSTPTPTEADTNETKWLQSEYNRRCEEDSTYPSKLAVTKRKTLERDEREPFLLQAQPYGRRPTLRYVPNLPGTLPVTPTYRPRR